MPGAWQEATRILCSVYAGVDRFLEQQPNLVLLPELGFARGAVGYQVDSQFKQQSDWCLLPRQGTVTISYLALPPSLFFGPILGPQTHYMSFSLVLIFLETQGANFNASLTYKPYPNVGSRADAHAWAARNKVGGYS